MKTDFFKGVIFSVLSALCFSTLAVFAKFGYLNGYNTNTLLFYRFLFATLIFFTFIFFKNKNLLKINPQGLFKCFLTGFLLYGLQATFFFLSVKYIGASMSSFILYMYPFVVTILSIIVFKQKPEKIIIFTLIITFIGIVFIFYEALNFNLPFTGIMFGFLAMLTFSVYLISVQFVLKDLNSYTFTLYVMFFAFIFFGISGFKDIIFVSVGDLPYFILLGLIPTSLAIILLFKAIDNIGSSRTSIFSTVEPFATLFFSYIIFNEMIGFFQIIGGILIVSGIIISNLYKIKLNI